MNNEWIMFINQQYGLVCENIGTKESPILRWNNEKLILQPLSAFYHQEIDQLAQLSESLRSAGHQKSMFIHKTIQGPYTIQIQNQPYVLCSMPLMTRGHSFSYPKNLAKLHRDTLGIDINTFKESPYLRNNMYWGERVDNLKKKVDQSLNSNHIQPFEQKFIRVFPYFIGLSENAIQYYVDWNMDSLEIEPPVLCHYRVKNQQMSDNGVDNPAEWVIDHRSRDIADWIRDTIWKTHTLPINEVDVFLQHYHEIFPLTEDVLSRIYGRLLLPISFIECGEDYYFGEDRSEEMMKQLKMIIQKSEKMEQFLKSFANRYHINAVDWLKTLT
ncbi:hypothetical protein [Terrilactibacillus laevilacticus]|uniref:Spore coat protein YutH n=1 Tax=Terrilactibacillus laevilacticus TaxID=1380157 RepID=A0ABW5PSR1_9BACI|nr:hypothetical protein [Terrilactibacillus laevilacticus]